MVLGENVSIGPHCIIEDRVAIGANTVIGNFSTICSNTEIGADCRIFHYCSIGEAPQDLKYAGEVTRTKIGDRVTIRENVTINRGTAAHGTTHIGDDCLLMAYVHIAHDCIVGNHVIFANLSTLGGHVEIGDWASLGGGVLVHQFTRIGEHAFIGGGYRVVQDVPPYILAQGEPLQYGGINSIGLRRRNFSNTDRAEIKNAYRQYFRSELNRSEALQKIRDTNNGSPYLEKIVQFISGSSRGII